MHNNTENKYSQHDKRTKAAILENDQKVTRQQSTIMHKSIGQGY